jgi:hypothetical protein
MKLILKFAVLFLFFVSCKKEVIPCNDVCQNQGTFNVPTCSCDCPLGYKGTNCQIKATPLSIVIDTIIVNTFKMTDANGLAWDPLNVGIDRNPDIYPVILSEDLATTYYLKKIEAPNSINSSPIKFILATPIVINGPYPKLTIRLYDKDIVTPDQYMEGITGNLYDPTTPPRKTFSCNTCDVSFDISLKYNY